MVTRFRVRNTNLRGEVIVLRGGPVTTDADGLLPVDLSPEQLAHVRRGIGHNFDQVDVTGESVLREQLAACEAKLPEIAAGVEQAGKIFDQWHERHTALMGQIEEIRAQLDEVNDEGGGAAPGSDGGEKADPPPPPANPASLADLSWDDLKELAKAHDIGVGRRSREDIEADVSAALAADNPKE